MFRWFSREIWRSLKFSAVDRARYLKSLFSEVVGDFEPLFYLDVGAGLGYNSVVFGENAKEIVAVDLRFPEDNVLKGVSKASMVLADARFLPFKNCVFDAVSLFSVIEHIAEKQRVLKEAVRVLKMEGFLIVQVPNRFFPVDLHSGLPFVFLVPYRIRGAIFKKFGHEGLGRIDVPSIKHLEEMILHINPRFKVYVKKIIYPSIIVWPKLRFFYNICSKIGILKAIPLGYLSIFKKM